MPIAYALDPERRRLRAVASGPISFEDVRAHLLREHADGNLGYPELIDGTSAQVTFTPQQVRQIVALMHELGAEAPLGPAAVLVGSDLAFGMLRMLELLLDGTAMVKPFRSRLEAEAWLASMGSSPMAYTHR